MSDTVESLENLNDLGGEAVAETVINVEPKIDEFGRAYGTGRRKSAVARVWIKPGTGKITINGKDQTENFARPVLRMIIEQPLIAA